MNYSLAFFSFTIAAQSLPKIINHILYTTNSSGRILVVECHTVVCTSSRMRLYGTRLQDFAETRGQQLARYEQELLEAAA